MRKTVYILILLILCSIVSPFAVLASEEVDPECWDGSAADGFAGGEGTKDDPYRIETPEQLAYLRVSVENGENYKDKHVKLCRDLYMNDETFTFDPDTGLVKVSDGKNVSYRGTGIAGDDSGENVAFDTNPSIRGSWYGETDLFGAMYGGTVLEWTPIGTVMNTEHGSRALTFHGTFDGAGHTIYGIMVVETVLTGDRGGGLFSFLMEGNVKNLHMDDSLIIGRSYVGGIVGRTHSYNTHIQNCSSGAIVIGNKYVGGLAGQMYDSPYLIGCENRGLVISDQYAGGIAGDGKGASYCLNLGAVYGTQSVGGILGSFGGAGESSIYGVKYCTNFGRITAKSHRSSTAYGGGICGTSSKRIHNCHNGGYIYGNSYAGGICGMYTANEPVADCCNTAQVKGGSVAGGITGKGAVVRSRNDGPISGATLVGGVCGLPSATDCQNTGSVSGKRRVGGIVGEGYAKGCANYGNIDGESRVGGVIGVYNNIGNDKSIIQNCYNKGSVTAEKMVGGIVGEAGTATRIITCYNMGAVTGGQYMGAVAGFWNADTITENTYYLQNCAVDTNKVIQAGMGSEDGVPIPDGEGMLACDESQWQRAGTFRGFDFLQIWQENALGPTLRAESTLLHDPTETENENYFYKSADCAEGVRYHTSCSCGAVLGSIFSVGQGNGHRVLDEVLINESMHYRRCEDCYRMVDGALHDFSMSHVKVGEKEGWVIFTCTECQYKNSISFDLPVQEPEEEHSPEKQPDPLEESKPEEPKKAEFKLDLRFVLLLTAGIVLGAMGSYGVLIMKKTKKDVETKKKDFL